MPDLVNSQAMAVDDSDAGRALRAASRGTWPVHVFALGEEPGDDISGSTTAAERISMMWPLAREAWRVAGRPIPTYTRESLPSCVFRKGARRPDDDDEPG